MYTFSTASTTAHFCSLTSSWVSIIATGQFITVYLYLSLILFGSPISPNVFVHHFISVVSVIILIPQHPPVLTTKCPCLKHAFLASKYILSSPKSHCFFPLVEMAPNLSVQITLKNVSVSFYYANM